MATANPTTTARLEIKERPIPFSAPMVQAILAGRKTQTRRLVKPARGRAQYSVLKVGMPYAADPWNVWWHGPETDRVGVLHTCPYGVPGDRLWVRETFCWKRDPLTARLDGYWYRASNPEVVKTDGDGHQVFRKDGVEASPWISGLRMPRAASRITLEVTDVRVQRLQEISDEDAKAEGVTPYTGIGPDQRVPGPGFEDALLSDQPHRLPFADLWGQINDKRAPWESNPWVWAITFRRAR